MMTSENLILNSPLPFAVTEGESHTLRHVNAAFCELHGKSDTELIGRPISSALSGPGFEAVLALLDRVYGGGKSGFVSNLNYFSNEEPLGYRSYTVWSLPVIDYRLGDLIIQATDLTDETYAHRLMERTTHDIIALNREICEVNEQLLMSGLRLKALADRSQAIADALQQALLWQEPERTFGSLKVAVTYESSGDEALVGGDLFDAITLPNKSILLVVGDVTGKGLKAASRTSEIIYALRAFAMDCQGPGDIMARLNELIYQFHEYTGDDVGNPIVVLSLIVIDEATGAAKVTCAGAEPPWVLRATGTDEEIYAQGLILGIRPNTTYNTTDFVLDPDDTLLMATDGIPELHHGRDFFGYDRILAVARGIGEKASLSDVGAAILEEARDFAGGRFNDDVCVLLARRGSPE